MTLYERTAFDLLNVVQNPMNSDDFLFLGEQGYVFTYRRNYAGMMAYINPRYARIANSKQGFFDVLANMNEANLTHSQLYDLLLETTTLTDCLNVWRGIMPEATGQRKHALLSLAMLMFEQEINFGNEVFQRRSHYSPLLDNPNYSRPRDLMMGYVLYMFSNNNTTCLRQFQNYRGLLLPPPEGEVKIEYFDVLRDDNEAVALMSRPNVLRVFRETANNAPRNPNL